MSAFVTTRTDISAQARAKPGSAVLRIALMIEDMFERRRSRLALLEMSDEMLKDIGVSRSEAFREANRPFWG